MRSIETSLSSLRAALLAMGLVIFPGLGLTADEPSSAPGSEPTAEAPAAPAADSASATAPAKKAAPAHQAAKKKTKSKKSLRAKSRHISASDCGACTVNSQVASCYKPTGKATCSNPQKNCDGHCL